MESSSHTTVQSGDLSLQISLNLMYNYFVIATSLSCLYLFQSVITTAQGNESPVFKFHRRTWNWPTDRP